MENSKSSGHCNQRPWLAIAGLGVASGLPLALSSTTLQAWYTDAGLSLVSVGALSIVGQPYLFKFLWAPLLDRYRCLGLDRRRGWLIVTQLFLALILFIMGCLHPHNNPWLLGWLALSLALFSATQDIAIDAYRTERLLPEQRSWGITWAVYGYRIGFLISGVLALLIAAHWGWDWAFWSMGTLMLLFAGGSYFIKPIAQEATTSAKGTGGFKTPWQNLLQKPHIALVLLFIVLYKLPDAFGISLLTPFLMRGLGYDLIAVGGVLKIAGWVGTLCGGFLGGWLIQRGGLYRCLLGFALVQLLTDCGLLLLSNLAGYHFANSQWYYCYTIAILYMTFTCDALLSIALLTFLTSLCDVRYTATQFALLSAISSIPRVWVGPVAGWVANQGGWNLVYAGASFLEIFPILLLLLIIFKKNHAPTLQKQGVPI